MEKQIDVELLKKLSDMWVKIRSLQYRRSDIADDLVKKTGYHASAAGYSGCIFALERILDGHTEWLTDDEPADRFGIRAHMVPNPYSESDNPPE